MWIWFCGIWMRQTTFNAPWYKDHSIHVANINWVAHSPSNTRMGSVNYQGGRKSTGAKRGTVLGFDSMMIALSMSWLCCFGIRKMTDAVETHRVYWIPWFQIPILRVIQGNLMLLIPELHEEAKTFTGSFIHSDLDMVGISCSCPFSTSFSILSKHSLRILLEIWRSCNNFLIQKALDLPTQGSDLTTWTVYNDYN